MNKLQIKEDIYVYEFDELQPYKTYVYVIERDQTLYIIDTFCGSFYMEMIKADYPMYSYVVINTHYHFDHIWGNSSFQDVPIYAHQTCKDMILQHGQADLIKNHKEAKGVHKLTLPNHCFRGHHYSLPHDLTLYYTPGHSIDCISVYDAKNQLYFVGDALEKPLVQFEIKLLDVFHKTLLFYLNAPVSTFYAGHTLHLTKQDVTETLRYIEALQVGKECSFTDPVMQNIHEQNLSQ